MIQNSENDVTIWNNRWIHVKEKSTLKYPDPYTYITMGDAVAILPYRKTTEGKFEFGIRKEIVPPWGYEPSVCCVGGSVENSNPIQTAIDEVKEETGYIIKAEDLVHLGRFRNGKATDSFTEYYFLELSGEPQTEITGDGSMYEEGAEFLWVNDAELMKCDDYKIHVLIGYFFRMKLYNVLNQQ